MYQRLISQIVAEETDVQVRDVREIFPIIGRIFARVALLLDQEMDFTGDNEPLNDPSEEV